MATQEDIQALAAYIQAPQSDTAFVTTCVETANALIAAKTAGRTVPAEILKTAMLEVGANLYGRRAGRRDTASFGDPEVQAPLTRPALDPLTPALPILRPYLTPGIA